MPDNNYDYTKPFSWNTNRIIERNRKEIEIEAQYANVRPEFINSIPIPTTPLSLTEVRTMVRNAAILQSEYDLYHKSSTNNTTNSSSSSSSGSFADCDTVVQFLLIALALLISLSPLIYVIFKVACK